MKKLLLALIIIISARSLYCMENYEQSAPHAEEFNMLHCPLIQLPSEMLLHIFTHCHNNKDDEEKYLRNQFYSQGFHFQPGASFLENSKIFLKLRMISKFFNKLLTLEKIGSFYKDYDQLYKDSTLQYCISLMYFHYSLIRLPAFIILHAGANVNEQNACRTFLEYAVFKDDEQAVEMLFNHHADPNTKMYPDYKFEKQYYPLFFYAKTKKIASMFIANGVDIHQKSPIFNTNVLWHIVNGQYPSELMQLYLEKKVGAEQLDPFTNSCLLHHIVSKYFNSGSLYHKNENDINNLLTMNKYLLNSIPHMINAVDIYGKTPLAIAQENLTNTQLGFQIWIQMTSSQIHKADVQKSSHIIEAIEKLITLFENTAQELEQKTAFDVATPEVQEIMQQYLQK